MSGSPGLNSTVYQHGYFMKSSFALMEYTQITVRGGNQRGLLLRLNKEQEWRKSETEILASAASASSWNAPLLGRGGSCDLSSQASET